MQKKSMLDLHRISTEEFKQVEKIPVAVVLDDVEDVRLDNIFTPKKLTTDDVVLRNHSNVLF